MSNALVIVESPAKAKTIAGYLGDGYVVESSIGHVRDLPRNAAEVPKAYKGEPWARIGIDTGNDFKPLYVVSSDKKDQIKKLKALLADADELYLATDEDREGEAIAWHLHRGAQSQGAGSSGWSSTRSHATRSDRRSSHHGEIDRRLVDAQEARRLLDRLYGYEVSTVLWKKVMPQLSAGRVQSVADQDHRRARAGTHRFRLRRGTGASTGTFAAAEGDDKEFTARLAELDGRRLATGRDFDRDGTLSRADAMVLDEAGARALVAELDGVGYAVRSRESKPYRRRPAAPFITSTFQQEAGRKLGMSAAVAMRGGPGALREGLHHLHADRQHDTVGDGAERGESVHRRGVTEWTICPTHRASTPRR